MPVCKKCQSSFEVTADDLSFLEKVSPVIRGKIIPIAPPTLCPDCRMRRRMAFRNERNLHSRTCELCHKNTISVFSPDKPYTVYCTECWWGDGWNAFDYGQEIDFSRPFFDQLKELWLKVPAMGLWNLTNENADYNNNCFNIKDSYMSFNADFGQNYFYCQTAYQGNNLYDCAFISKSELCYECIDCRNAYHCFFSQELENCQDCYFSSDLIGCHRCFGSHGLRQRDLYLFNEKVTEEQWNDFMKNLTLTPDVILDMKKRSEAIRLKLPHPPVKNIQCEDCTGDHLTQCRNCLNCFDSIDCENMKNCIYGAFMSDNVQDAYAFGGLKWEYEHIGGGENTEHNAFIFNTAHGLNNSYYCTQCHLNSKNLFGCVGLKKQSYCILNKQYSKEEYEALVPRIIEHMKRTGEWGEFFDVRLSQFGYNETIAQEYYPLEEKEALRLGFQWSNHESPPPTVDRVIPAARLPEKITDIPDDILKWAVECEVTRKPFKIILHELKFYRENGLPIPRRHPTQRHLDRLALRRPHRLFSRNCQKCQMPIRTTYAEGRPETVYCETCYRKEIY